MYFAINNNVNDKIDDEYMIMIKTAFSPVTRLSQVKKQFFIIYLSL